MISIIEGTDGNRDVPVHVRTPLPGPRAGPAEGEPRAILRILDRRGVAVDDASRQRIESCTDLETLGTRLDRSLGHETVSANSTALKFLDLCPLSAGSTGRL